MVFAAGDAVEAAVVAFRKGTVRQKLADDLYDVQITPDAGLSSNEHCVVHETLLRAAADKNKDCSSSTTAAHVRVTAPCKLENTEQQSNWKHMLISLFGATALDSITATCERRLQNAIDLAAPSSKKHTSSSSIASEYKTADSAEIALTKGDAVTFRVHFPGDEVVANPKESTVRFLRELHCLDIDIEVNKDVESSSTTVTGVVDVWCGTRLITTVPLAFEIQQQSAAAAAAKKDKPSGGIGGHLKMLKTLRANNGVSPAPSPTTTTLNSSSNPASGTVTPTTPQDNSAATAATVGAATTSSSPTATTTANTTAEALPASDVETATLKAARVVVPAAAVTVLDGKKPSKLSLSLTRPTSRAGFQQHTADNASATIGATERVAADSSSSTHVEAHDHTSATTAAAMAAVTSGASTARHSAASDSADMSSDSDTDDVVTNIATSTGDNTSVKRKGDSSSTQKSTTAFTDIDTVEHTADDLAEAKSKLTAQLSQGLVLLKHSRNGKAVDRTVRSKDACKTITWGSESYKLSDCSGVRCGTEVTEHMPKLDTALVSRTFSLMFAKRSLDFTCSDAQEMAQVSLGFKACLQGL
jgi:hypothetical protein